MIRSHAGRRRAALSVSIALAALAAVGCASSGGSPPGVAAAKTKAFYVDPSSTTLEAAARLDGEARELALRLGRFASATWFTKGTPAEVRAAARDLVERAAADGTVPVLVAYNLPFRDCSQYSAGGAASIDDYAAWIDALAAGIGRRRAIVILEPDGLGIIPFHAGLDGQPEWCKPKDANPASAAADRYAALNHAVDALKANPAARVYLDGTHSAWLGVGDIARRLVRAGVQRADGFFLNASNYQPTSKQQRYGAWISQCIDYATNPAGGSQRLGRYEACASQYHPAKADDESSWATSDAWYAENAAPGPRALKRFVIDTSRNGQGAWAPPAGTNWPDPQTWCNPPGRGLGLPPSADTGEPLVDAYLWIKVPGESDGQCDRGTGSAIDPARGMADPPAGAWFPQQAEELVRLAKPAIGAR